MAELTVDVGATGTVFLDTVPADWTFATPPTWASSDDAIATIVAAADGRSATYTAVAVGAVTFTATDPTSGMTSDGATLTVNQGTPAPALQSMTLRFGA